MNNEDVKVGQVSTFSANFSQSDSFHADYMFYNMSFAEHLSMVRYNEQ